MPVLTVKRGLVTSPNELARPDGAADIMDNCVIDSDNVIEPRRGFAEFGNSTDDQSVVKQLLTYKGRILRHFSNKLSFDSTGNGSFLNFSGSYSELVNRLRIKYFELNSNLYFTTNEGIKKISAKSADDLSTSSGYITNSGGVKAVGLEANTVPTVSGFLPAQSKVAYKLLWARKDANGNVIRGVPSSRHVVTNNSIDLNVGESFNIEVLDAGAGIHKSFDATSSISDGTQIIFLAAAVNITDNTIALTSGATDHNYQTNDLIKLKQNGSDALPTGLAAGNYYVIRVDTNKIKLKTTPTGTEVDITATGVSGIVESTTVGKTITIASHGYTDGTKVRLFSTLANELDAAQTYYIRNKTTDTFQLSATDAGTIITLTKKIGTSEIYSGISNNDFFTFDSPTNKFAVWFNISGNDPSPTSSLLLGRQLVQVPIYNITTKNKVNYASKIAESLFSISDIQVEIGSSTITITNRDGGDVLNANQGSIDISYAIISTAYDGQITVGTPCNVYITSTVPNEIDSKDFFYEVYRTAIVTVSTGLTLNDIDPGEEFQKIYESPVSTNGTIPTEIEFDDYISEVFREGGSYLYINPVTGEGILQANEAPPIAHDVAIFKGSAFYANTKERHRLQLSMLNVSQYNSGVSKMYIGNSSKLGVYTFIGQNEIIDFTAKKKSETVGGSYFDIFTAQNKIKYRVWFDKGYITFNFNQTSINSTSNEITITNHGLATNDTVFIDGTTLPGGLLEKSYYVIRISSNVIKLSNSIGGSEVDLDATSGNASISHTSQTPVLDNCLLVKIPLKLYDDTVQGTIDAFKYAFSDISDFEVNNMYYEFDSNYNVSSVNDTITIKNHGFINGDTIVFSKECPDGISIGTTYYVIDKTSDTFKISLSLAGPSVNLTSKSGIARVTYIEPSSIIRFVYSDNGEVDPITQSVPASGWLNPSVFRTGIGEDASLNHVLLSGLASQSLSIEDTARSLERVINKDPNSPVNAYYLSGLNDLPGILLFESRSLLDDPFYIAFSEEFLDFSGNTITVFEPSLPIVKIVTKIESPFLETPYQFTTSTNHNFILNQEIYTYIDPTTDSIKNPTIIGKKLISNIISPNKFTLYNVMSVNLSSFDTAIVFPADVVSDNSVNPNRVYFSKIYQPEAVPLVNYIDIGPRDKKIQRIIALRDSLAVLKEEGVYIISGQSAPNFALRLCDSSALTFAPDTAISLNNLVYVLTSQGVVTVSETGVQIMSRNIENKIQEVTNTRFDYKLMSWGMSSESDRCYILWLPEKTTDGYATQAFRYNTFTRAWTRWTKPANCGVVNPSDDRIYLGDSSGRPYVLQERKNFERQDYSDREIIRTLGSNAISGTTFTLSSVAELAAGDVITQTQYLDINKFNRFLKKLDRDLSSSGSITSASAANPTIITSIGHGLSSGDVIDITVTNSTPKISGLYPITFLSSNTFSINVNVTVAGTTGTWRLNKNYYSQLKAVTGDSLGDKLQQVELKLQSDGIPVPTSTGSNVSTIIASNFNAIVQTLNDPLVLGNNFKDYKEVTDILTYEVLITGVNPLVNTVTVKASNKFVVGDISVFKGIKCVVQYAPQHFGKPEMTKQISEGTLIFDQNNFWGGVIAYSSDRSFDFKEVAVSSKGPGYWDGYSWANVTFGGLGNEVPMRTLIPADKTRCRYLHVQFKHVNAREKWKLLGVSLEPREVSSRGYR